MLLSPVQSLVPSEKEDRHEICHVKSNLCSAAKGRLNILNKTNNIFSNETVHIFQVMKTKALYLSVAHRAS